MLLTPSEITDLTGYRVPAYQIRWLREHGWVFEVGADRRPKVLAAYANRRLGGEESASHDPQLRLTA